MSVKDEWDFAKNALSEICDEVARLHGTFKQDTVHGTFARMRNVENLKDALQTCGLSMPKHLCVPCGHDSPPAAKFLWGEGRGSAAAEKELQSGDFYAPEKFILIDIDNGNIIAEDEYIDVYDEEHPYVVPLCKMVAVESNSNTPEPVLEPQVIRGWLGIKFTGYDEGKIAFYSDWGYGAQPVTLPSTSGWLIGMGHCAIFTDNDSFNGGYYRLRTLPLAPRNFGLGAHGMCVWKNSGYMPFFKFELYGSTTDAGDTFKPIEISQELLNRVQLEGFGGFTLGCPYFYADGDNWSSDEMEGLGVFLGETMEVDITRMFSNLYEVARDSTKTIIL